ncbi:hypothetical protein GGR54DRAFT_654898 [Hypoxylon sp. NC1633]|nr:hypothetical protein GGR54DRAFT_654898 [Hypoxylon sp. NC1633]
MDFDDSQLPGRLLQEAEDLFERVMDDSAAPDRRQQVREKLKRKIARHDENLDLEKRRDNFSHESRREGLTAKEYERREDIFTVVAKARVFDGSLWDRVATIELSHINKMLKQSIMPFVSADYLNWEVDNTFWQLVSEKEGQLKWPRPPKYGVPYSAKYLEAFMKNSEKEHDKRKNTGEVLARIAHFMPEGGMPSERPSAPQKEREAIHISLVGRLSPYLQHCGPMEIHLPCALDVHIIDELFEEDTSAELPVMPDPVARIVTLLDNGETYETIYNAIIDSDMVDGITNKGCFEKDSM